MAYAARSDVLARAGKFASAWSATTSPSLTDIDGFITDIAAVLNVAIAQHGITTPVTDPTAVAALKGINADGALLLALEPTFPGDTGPSAAQDFIERIETRYTAALDAIEGEDSDIIDILIGHTEATVGADSLWTSTDAGDVYTDVWTGEAIVASALPLVRRGQKF